VCLFHARDIAHPLALVANGASYRPAVQATRHAARRNHHGLTWGQRTPRKRQRALDGHLVVSWVDVFGPVVTYAYGHAHWPERIAVDNVGFRVGGYDSPYFREPKVWLMRPFAQKHQDAWEDSFDMLHGTPQRVVADMDAAISGAVAARFHVPATARRATTGATSTYAAPRQRARAAPRSTQPCRVETAGARAVQ
jgi:hypothetical protein